MDDILPSQPQSQSTKFVDSQPTVLAGPKGIGMAVAFDWGLTVQLLVGPFLPLLLNHSAAKPGLGSVALSFLISLPAALLIAVFGEGIRRGWRWTRLVQVVVNSLGFLAGIFTLFGLWQSIRIGHYWPLVTSVILVIFSPLIAWRLSRPVTANWFAQISSVDARRRHGGAWPFLIALWALVGGILQALTVYFH